MKRLQVAKSQLEFRKLSFFLSAMIHTPFKNEESPTPKLISSLDRATFSLHFQNEYYLAYSLLILSSKRSISNGIEWKTNPESFKTRRDL